MSERAEVVELAQLAWPAGAPEPLLVSSEHRTFFAFYAPDHGTTGAGVRVAQFIDCVAVRLGFPNDEALQGHRLWGHGLQFGT